MKPYRKSVADQPAYIASLLTQNGYVFWTDRGKDGNPYILLRQAGPFIEAWQPESQEWINAPWERLSVIGPEGPQYRTLSREAALDAMKHPEWFRELDDAAIAEELGYGEEAVDRLFANRAAKV